MNVRRATRRKVGQMKRRILLPTARRLDERPDLAMFDIGRHSWGHLTVANRNAGCALKVGQFCSFAFGTEVLLGGEHRTDYVTTYRFGSYSPFDQTYPHAHGQSAVARGDITIGNDVWIGHRAMVLSGVVLGDGVVVGAGSVVRQGAPPYAIVVGNPARVAGFRFSPEQIEALLRIRWWDWSEEQITGALGLMMSPDVQAFIDAHDVDA